MVIWVEDLKKDSRSRRETTQDMQRWCYFLWSPQPTGVIEDPADLRYPQKENVAKLIDYYERR